MCGRHVAPLISQNAGPMQAAGSFTDSGAAPEPRGVESVPAAKAPPLAWKRAQAPVGEHRFLGQPGDLAGPHGRRVDRARLDEGRDSGGPLLRLERADSIDEELAGL